MVLNRMFTITLNDQEKYLLIDFKKMINNIAKEVNGYEEGENIEILCDAILSRVYELQEFIKE